MSDSKDIQALGNRGQCAAGVQVAFRRIVPASLTLTACLAFTSCGTMDTAKNFAKKSVGSVAKLMPSRIPVADVREKDLQELPTGADKALAYQRYLDRKRYASINFVPDGYRPPALPDLSGAGAGSGSILPPLNRGERSTD